MYVPVWVIVVFLLVFAFILINAIAFYSIAQNANKILAGMLRQERDRWREG